MSLAITSDRNVRTIQAPPRIRERIIARLLLIDVSRSERAFNPSRGRGQRRGGSVNRSVRACAPATRVQIDGYFFFAPAAAGAAAPFAAPAAAGAAPFAPAAGAAPLAAPAAGAAPPAAGAAPPAAAAPS